MYLSEIAQITHGVLIGKDCQMASLTLDTRTLLPGQVFVALKGEQFDGHDFINIAQQKKAAAVITSQPLTLDIPVIQVADTRKALGQLAAHHRQQFDLPVVAITGSCGKTTTKTMIAAILERMGPTLAPIKSFNNDIGVPLTLLQLNATHRYAVIEMGANHPHEIAYLSQIAQQQVAIITNVAPAHLEGFGSITGVAQAKGEIYAALTDGGIAIINADDQFASSWQPLLRHQSQITFGIQQKADVFATDIHLDQAGYPHFTAHYPDGKLDIQLPLLGKHNVINALAAIAATFAIGAHADAILQGLQHMTPVSKRLIEYKGLAGACIIDDTYNANPLSVTAALHTLAHRQGEKIFVFGDMAELGDHGTTFHHEIGQKASALGIDKLYAYGKLSAITADAFGQNGFYFDEQASLIAALQPVLHSKATVLVKGSRAFRMENIVQAIIQET